MYERQDADAFRKGFRYRIILGFSSVWGHVLYASNYMTAAIMAEYYGPGSTIVPLNTN